MADTASDDKPTSGLFESAQQGVNDTVGALVTHVLAPTIFAPIGLETTTQTVAVPLPDGPVDRDINQIRAFPLILIVLVIGGVYFTFFFKFINIRLFGHAIRVVKGDYDNPEDEGEISHFKALTSALSATVGLGNIAGVGIAIAAGGPGAVFWMWLTAVFGMSMKFASCTMSQIYRRTDARGHVVGGPMVYIEDGFKDLYPSKAGVGRALAILFSVCTVFAAIGAGNLFQANQTYAIIERQTFGTGNAPGYFPWLVGLGLAALAAVVIIGGIKRIGEFTSKMVPAMCLLYCSICLVIIVLNFTAVPAMIGSIFAMAFTGPALYGGFLGVLVQGMKRAAFSNEAGIGSAAIAHACAKTNEPVREGLVAMLGPFIDTICVCTMTALAILITQAHLPYVGDSSAEGITVTADALGSLGSVAPWLLMIAVFVFAFSTAISWGYYGERAILYLFGDGGVLPYRIVYCLVIIVGPAITLGSVVDFADMMLFTMAFPNILTLILFSRVLRERVADYERRLASGEMQPVKGS